MSERCSTAHLPLRPAFGLQPECVPAPARRARLAPGTGFGTQRLPVERRPTPPSHLPLTSNRPTPPCRPPLSAGPLDDLHSFDPATMTWTLLSAADFADSHPSARYSHGFTSAGGRLYVHGGYGNGRGV